MATGDWNFGVGRSKVKVMKSTKLTRSGPAGAPGVRVSRCLGNLTELRKRSNRLDFWIDLDPIPDLKNFFFHQLSWQKIWQTHCGYWSKVSPDGDMCSLRASVNPWCWRNAAEKINTVCLSCPNRLRVAVPCSVPLVLPVWSGLISSRVENVCPSPPLKAGVHKM